MSAVLFLAMMCQHVEVEAYHLVEMRFLELGRKICRLDHWSYRYCRRQMLKSLQLYHFEVTLYVYQSLFQRCLFYEIGSFQLSSPLPKIKNRNIHAYSGENIFLFAKIIVDKKSQYSKWYRFISLGDNNIYEPAFLLLLITQMRKYMRYTVGFNDVICSFRQLCSILIKNKNASRVRADIDNAELLLLWPVVHPPPLLAQPLPSLTGE